MTEARSRSTEALARAIGEFEIETDPKSIDDYLKLVEAAAEMEAAAQVILHDAVTSARSAGAAWSAVGATLGMSRQAAQKRFVTQPGPSADELDPHERVLGPVSALDEMKELALAGKYGWHSVEFGHLHHRVVRSDTQWEHWRITMLRQRSRAMQEEGWQLIGSEFPFSYLKRDLGTPALAEPQLRAEDS